MKKKTVHIISHSHWDREWYLPLERHKMKLLDLIDTNMELFDKDPGFYSFHLDGQTIVLDDYLEIRPEKREELLRHVREGHFRVGPFYILQDEFLTSGEANVRNLQTGIREAKAYGNLTKVGYFPDAFGNAGQMPQLLTQAGMEAVAFGRGVKAASTNPLILKCSGSPPTAQSFWVSCLQTGTATVWKSRWMKKKQRHTGRNVLQRLRCSHLQTSCCS